MEALHSCLFLWEPGTMLVRRSPISVRNRKITRASWSCMPNIRQICLHVESVSFVSCKLIHFSFFIIDWDVSFLTCRSLLYNAIQSTTGRDTLTSAISVCISWKSPLTRYVVFVFTGILETRVTNTKILKQRNKNDEILWENSLSSSFSAKQQGYPRWTWPFFPSYKLVRKEGIYKVERQRI